MAVCKTGHKVLFSTMLNTPAVHISLMEQTDCKALFTAQGVHVKDILASRPMTHTVIPELEVLLESGSVPHYPYEKTFEEAEHDPYLILHTSGTTGHPVSSFSSSSSSSILAQAGMGSVKPPSKFYFAKSSV